MLTTIEEARATLANIAELLEKPLPEALKGFVPDMDMRDITENYAKGWEGKTLHEFIVGVIASGQPDEPDISNSGMEPFNLFELLDILYRQKEP